MRTKGPTCSSSASASVGGDVFGAGFMTRSLWGSVDDEHGHRHSIEHVAHDAAAQVATSIAVADHEETRGLVREVVDESAGRTHGIGDRGSASRGGAECFGLALRLGEVLLGHRRRSVVTGEVIGCA